MHFIWFGTKPSYCDFAIDNFKHINPTFIIKTYFKSVQQIEHIALDNIIEDDIDIDIRKCIFEIFDKKSKYAEQVKRSKNIFKMHFIQVLADIFRLYILNKYGGIYLDCDTFPLKPFDNKLLEYKQFVVSRHMIYSNSIIPDYYFIGKDVQTPDISAYFTVPQLLLQTKKSWWNNPFYIQNKINFFKCREIPIKYKNTDFYIEHYNDNTWQKTFNNNIRTPKCKLDTLYV